MDCNICGSPLNYKFSHRLDCNHIYHYECIQKTFLLSRQKCKCPLCGKDSNGLPIVNGLPKLIKGIHYMDILPDYVSLPCTQLLKSGKRKGEECRTKCMLGMNVCNRHHKLQLKNT